MTEGLVSLGMTVQDLGLITILSSKDFLSLVLSSFKSVTELLGAGYKYFGPG